GLVEGGRVAHAGAVEVHALHEALEVAAIGADGGGAHRAEPLGDVAGDLAEQLLVGVGGAGGEQPGRRRGGPVGGRGGAGREGCHGRTSWGGGSSGPAGVRVAYPKYASTPFRKPGNCPDEKGHDGAGSGNSRGHGPAEVLAPGVS